jgi:hypothetical protein
MKKPARFTTANRQRSVELFVPAGRQYLCLPVAWKIRERSVPVKYVRLG